VVCPSRCPVRKYSSPAAASIWRRARAGGAEFAPSTSARVDTRDTPAPAGRVLEPLWCQETQPVWGSPAAGAARGTARAAPGGPGLRAIHNDGDAESQRARYGAGTAGGTRRHRGSSVGGGSYGHSLSTERSPAHPPGPPDDDSRSPRGGYSARAQQRSLRYQGRARQRRGQAEARARGGPWGQRGEARRSSSSSALPSRWGQERGLAAHPCAGAVQRWRCFSRCTDRSAGGCADRCTLATVRARATARWPPHSARGWQRRQGPPGVVASADHGGHHCAGAGIRRSGCPQRLGKTVRPCRRTDGVIRA
jgi:hypothetical protein